MRSELSSHQSCRHVVTTIWPGASPRCSWRWEILRWRDWSDWRTLGCGTSGCCTARGSRHRQMVIMLGQTGHTCRETGLTAMLDTRNNRSARQRQIRSLLNIENITWKNNRWFKENNSWYLRKQAMFFLFSCYSPFSPFCTRQQDWEHFRRRRHKTQLQWSPRRSRSSCSEQNYAIYVLVSNFSVINKILNCKWPKTDVWLNQACLFIRQIFLGLSWALVTLDINDSMIKTIW